MIMNDGLIEENTPCPKVTLDLDADRHAEIVALLTRIAESLVGIELKLECDRRGFHPAGEQR